MIEVGDLVKDTSVSYRDGMRFRVLWVEEEHDWCLLRESTSSELGKEPFVDVMSDYTPVKFEVGKRYKEKDRTRRAFGRDHSPYEVVAVKDDKAVVTYFIEGVMQTALILVGAIESYEEVDG